MKNSSSFLCVVLACAILSMNFFMFFPPQAHAVTLTQVDKCTLRSDITMDELKVLIPGCGVTTCPISDISELKAGKTVGADGSSADTEVTQWGVFCAFSPIKAIANIIFLVVSVLSIAAIVYAGFLFLRSAGDPTTVKDARNWLLFAIIGLAVAVFANAIPGIAITLLGLGG